MTNDSVLNIRIPSSLAERLTERQKNTLVPTSAFVRRAIEEALQKVEAEKSCTTG
jgi:predicted DNA-binding protein